ncbi:hypothetical protein QU487_07665 [Crenobacter sp. SG2305]|nr:hypothetical protein [Crenobacter sp. SG2305]MDN0082625.1 hypothetical protein [Crenobacter sp. SG2305]
MAILAAGRQVNYTSSCPKAPPHTWSDAMNESNWKDTLTEIFAALAWLH